MRGELGVCVKRVKGLRSTNWQLQYSHRYLKYNIGNIVNNILTMQGAWWVLYLLAWSLCKLYKSLTTMIFHFVKKCSKSSPGYWNILISCYKEIYLFSVFGFLTQDEKKWKNYYMKVFREFFTLHNIILCFSLYAHT